MTATSGLVPPSNAANTVALNRTHICVLHDVGEGPRLLVLHDRNARGPAVRSDSYALQVCRDREFVDRQDNLAQGSGSPAHARRACGRPAAGGPRSRRRRLPRNPAVQTSATSARARTRPVPETSRREGWTHPGPRNSRLGRSVPVAARGVWRTFSRSTEHREHR
jgi:hypothetical protein